MDRALNFLMEQFKKKRSCILDINLNKIEIITQFLSRVSVKSIIVSDSPKWGEEIEVVDPKSWRKMEDDWDVIVVDNAEKISLAQFKKYKMVVLVTGIGIRKPANREVLWNMLNCIQVPDLSGKKIFLGECLCTIEHLLYFPWKERYFRCSIEDQDADFYEELNKEYSWNLTNNQQSSKTENPDITSVVLDIPDYFIFQDGEYLTPKCYQNRLLKRKRNQSLQQISKKPKLQISAEKQFETEPTFQDKRHSIKKSLTDQMEPKSDLERSFKSRKTESSNITNVSDLTNQNISKKSIIDDKTDSEMDLDRLFACKPITRNLKSSMTENTNGFNLAGSSTEKNNLNNGFKTDTNNSNLASSDSKKPVTADKIDLESDLDRLFSFKSNKSNRNNHLDYGSKTDTNKSISAGSDLEETSEMKKSLTTSKIDSESDLDRLFSFKPRKSNRINSSNANSISDSKNTDLANADVEKKISVDKIDSESDLDRLFSANSKKSNQNSILKSKEDNKNDVTSSTTGVADKIDSESDLDRLFSFKPIKSNRINSSKTESNKSDVVISVVVKATNNVEKKISADQIDSEADLNRLFSFKPSRKLNTRKLNTSTSKEVINSSSIQKSPNEIKKSFNASIIDSEADLDRLFSFPPSKKSRISQSNIVSSDSSSKVTGKTNNEKSIINGIDSEADLDRLFSFKRTKPKTSPIGGGISFNNGGNKLSVSKQEQSSSKQKIEDSKSKIDPKTGLSPEKRASLQLLFDKMVPRFT